VVVVVVVVPMLVVPATAVQPLPLRPSNHVIHLPMKRWTIPFSVLQLLPVVVVVLVLLSHLLVTITTPCTNPLYQAMARSHSTITITTTIIHP